MKRIHCPICGGRMRKVHDGFVCDRDEIWAKYYSPQRKIHGWWTNYGLWRLDTKNFETREELKRYWKLKSFE